MAQKASVPVEVELDLEAQGVKSLLLARNGLLFKGALKVSDFFAASVPTVSCRLNIFFRVHKGLHPLVVRRIRLEQIYNVEGIVNIFGGVFYLEVEPLGHLRRKRVEV